MRSKKRQRVVTPIVGPRRRLTETIVQGKLEHRHQFHRRDAQRLEIRNLLGQPQIRAWLTHAARLGEGETANVHLVDHRLVQAASQVAVAAPVELVADDHALRRSNDSVFSRQKVPRQRLGIGVDRVGHDRQIAARGPGRRDRRLESDRVGRAPPRARRCSRCRPSGSTRGPARSLRPAPDRPCFLYSSTRIAVARRLNTARNCTPPSWAIAPYGKGWENRSVNGRSDVERVLNPTS